jgi:RNase P subunit RPR2
MSGLIRNKTLYAWYTQQGGRSFKRVLCADCNKTPLLHQRYVSITVQESCMRGDDTVTWLCTACAAHQGMVDPNQRDKETTPDAPRTD